VIVWVKVTFADVPYEGKGYLVSIMEGRTRNVVAGSTPRASSVVRDSKWVGHDEFCIQSIAKQRALHLVNHRTKSTRSDVFL
jgi:hypothetical protein